MLNIKVQISDINDMYNVITGQCTYDVIKTINDHSRVNYNSKGRELVSARNAYYNRVNRFDYNHNFNRNRYVKRRSKRA